MRMMSLMNVRFNMRATVLNDYQKHQVEVDSDGKVDTTNAVTGGHWETVQDDITGALTQQWIEDTVVVPPPRTGPGTTLKPSISRFDIECYVRGFPEVGFRSSANTENWEDGIYKAMESIQMSFPAKYVLNRMQFVTNIRGRDDRLLWLEEETGQPTVFEVQGVTPTFDPFGRHIDNLAVLKRADIQ